MNLTDRRGNPVSTTSRATLELHEAAVDLFHGYYGDPLGANQAALQEDKDFVMGHCFAAGLMLSTTERALLPEARKAIEAGQARTSWLTWQLTGRNTSRLWDGDRAKPKAKILPMPPPGKGTSAVQRPFPPKILSTTSCASARYVVILPPKIECSALPSYIRLTIL